MLLVCHVAPAFIENWYGGTPPVGLTEIEPSAKPQFETGLGVKPGIVGAVGAVKVAVEFAVQPPVASEIKIW